MAGAIPISTTPLPSLANFDLIEVAEDIYVGRIEGFPILIKAKMAAESGGTAVEKFAVLQCQVQFVGVSECARLDPAMIKTPDIRELIDLGRVHVSYEENIARIMIFDADRAFLDGRLRACIEEVLTVIRSQGGTALDRNCHQCKFRVTRGLTYLEEGVAQICDECLQARLDTLRQDNSLTFPGAMKTLLFGLVATVIGTAIWASFSYFLFDHVKNLHLPGSVFGSRGVSGWLAYIAVIGIGIGACIGRIIACAPNRGRSWSCFVAVLAAIATAVLGDTLVVWMCWARVNASISLIDSFKVLPEVWLRMILDTPATIISTVLMVVIAASLAPPTKTLRAIENTLIRNIPR